MAKGRKTRQQKIISQLRRQLQQPTISFKPVKNEISQEPVLTSPKIHTNILPVPESKDMFSLSYNPRLIKRDLFKTLILSLIVIGIELVLYLRLK